MKQIGLPLGKSDFESIRENALFYVDKTPLIEELLKKNGTEVFLFTRPRRFGKTLALSMLSSFFDISKDSTRLFAGLKISENSELCEERMNRSPTVFISFKSVDGLSYDDAFARLSTIMMELFTGYTFLLKSDKVFEQDKERFNRIFSVDVSREEIISSLSLLVRMLYAHYGKKVVLLIDEYDVPMAKASANGYYREMTDVMRGILQVLKDNSCLDFAVVTGCLRIAKESIFTGINNVYSNSVTSNSFNEFFGFTEEDVTKAFSKFGHEDKLSVVKEWYDGYHFGNRDIYCPWDVICYLDDLSIDFGVSPKNYWANTSSNDIIEAFVSRGSRTMFEKFNTLLAGDYIIAQIDENITYDYLHSTDDNLWNILLSTGYLTPVRKEELAFSLPDDEIAMKIPNKEILSIFTGSLTRWIGKESRKEDLSVLTGALWKGDAETVGREMTRILNKTLSYDDVWHEYVYHIFFAGIFKGLGYSVDSNREHGMGKPDIVVYDKDRMRVAVFEVKGERDTLKKALSQIEKKRYADDLFNFRLVLCYGVRFTGKTAEVVLKDRIER